ncbi:MAG: hypothetical protein FJZ56_00680 [Chlamydiae bacterium]|nr:hypothetical protein [Chlamydiota bacterium]
MKIVSFLSHDFTHHLDHLAPLCYALNAPLIVDSPLTYEMGKTFYPFVDIRLEDPINLFSWSNASLVLLSTRYAGKELKATFGAFGKDKIRFCFCPHGQSDKGYKKEQIDPFYHQDVALVYGRKMLSNKKALQTVKDTVTVGNYRLWFFKKFEKEYRSLLHKTLPKLQDTTRKIYLFAPTWQDGENPSSFFHKTEELITSLPKHIHLIIKIHPLLEKHYPAHVIRVIERYKDTPNVDILLHYPLIYPLLSKVDVYIGDYSSIGYDFLYFKKPMFFFSTSSQIPSLHQCGIQIPSKESSIFSFIQKNLDQTLLDQKKKQLYKHSFFDFDKEAFEKNLHKLL